MKLLVLAVLVLALIGCGSGGGPLGPGDAVPPFSVTSLDRGGTMTGKDLAGKLVLVDFWATWCGPCIQAMPEVQEAYRKYGDKLVVVAISNEDQQTVAGFHKGLNFSYPLYLDDKNSANLAFKVGAFPTFFILRDGKVIASQEGFEPGWIARTLEDATKS